MALVIAGIFLLLSLISVAVLALGPTATATPESSLSKVWGAQVPLRTFTHRSVVWTKCTDYYTSTPTETVFETIVKGPANYDNWDKFSMAKTTRIGQRDLSWSTPCVQRKTDRIYPCAMELTGVQRLALRMHSQVKTVNEWLRKRFWWWL